MPLKCHLDGAKKHLQSRVSLIRFFFNQGPLYMSGLSGLCPTQNGRLLPDGHQCAFIHCTHNDHQHLEGVPSIHNLGHVMQCRQQSTTTLHPGYFKCKAGSGS